MPLTLDEIEGLVASDGAPLRRNPRTLSHFLTRVQATSVHHIDQMQRAHAEVEHLRSKARGRVGASTTLSPLDAVRYLTDEQRAALFDGLQRDSYEATTRARKEAEDAAAEARKSASLIKLKFMVLAEDPDVPQQVREKIVAALAAVDTAMAEPTQTEPPAASSAAPSSASERDTAGAQVERLSELFG